MKKLVTLIAALGVGTFGCGSEGGGGAAGTGGVGATGGTGGVGTQEVSIGFAAKVGDEDFVCGTVYNDLGANNTPLELVDFRFYVEGVELRNESGDWVSMTLDDNDFQTDDVALLDFEDGCGEFGNPQLNNAVSGTVPDGTYDAISFRMGVPADINHLNNAVQPPPMNLSDMFWAWETGYKFLRFDSGSFAGGGWRMHLGSTDCTGDPNTGEKVSCTNPNRVQVELEGFDVDSNTVVADFAALVAGADLDANQEGTPTGCMASPGDMDCAPLFGNLGLAFGGNPAPDGQSFFTAQ
jgi:uncharacterized repeat protein (TIGR04052 family)